ncbi:formyltetrahydrofolate deformylase [Sulfobacillus thermosulfidooxidans]|nr:formyltetrahydrofolate deformylase [Sulfobacillus thermosulfidooxidans]OLZ13508.1 formyltetrahydrofolate deformylase [Sulfobacillus thermosulfidooxidans]OLZ20768.1 formyltetrahydrofolate deformylase [Sulfobacillus thermosulfidooxidans]
MSRGIAESPRGKRETVKGYRLLVACPDQPGIIAAISHVLARNGCNITSFDQYSEGPAGLFFMRAEFDMVHNSGDSDHENLISEFDRLAREYHMQWRLTERDRAHHLAVLVSREDHCLNELLWQTERGDIHAEISVIISNHEDLRELAEHFRIPFYYIPVTPAQKAQSEEKLHQLVRDYAIDTLVLARYMQILSEEFVSQYPARIINIHHSFLPAFVGPKPYHQAYERGVKLIGATAHYVTAELDAGPIIEQDVHRVDHRHQLDDFKRIGRQVERIVLARAVKWHVADRVLVYGNRTVVFPI